MFGEHLFILQKGQGILMPYDPHCMAYFWSILFLQIWGGVGVGAVKLFSSQRQQDDNKERVCVLKGGRGFGVKGDIFVEKCISVGKFHDHQTLGTVCTSNCQEFCSDFAGSQKD